MTDSKSRGRRITLIVLSAVAAAAIAVTPFSGSLAAIFSRDAEPTETTAPTSAPPVLTIKPLPVRPVVSAFVTTPEQCPPPEPTPPAEPTRICDITRTAVYELQPEALRLQLTKVDAYLNPLTGAQVVQMTMTEESSKQFAQFTADRVGQQVAFVRGSTVVWGPKISAPIDGQVLQLSGELTQEQAAEVARMLRDDA